MFVAANRCYNWLNNDNNNNFDYLSKIGQERFGNMTRIYYKDAVGAFIVFDITRQQTFEAVTKWKQDLDQKLHLADGSFIPCVLLANKVILASFG